MQQIRLPHVSLSVIPRCSDGILVPQRRVVLLDGVGHLRPQVVFHLTSEDVAEDASDDQDDKHEEEKDEVGQKHTFHLLQGTHASQEADEDYNAASNYQNVCRGDEELISEQTLDVGLVH